MFHVVFARDLCLVYFLKQLDLMGYMHFWELTIDTVTTIILVLSIGITVDYSAHIGHAFMAARKGDKNGKDICTTSIVSLFVQSRRFSFLFFTENVWGRGAKYIHRSRPRHKHKATKYKKCFGLTMLTCIKQHLSNV